MTIFERIFGHGHLDAWQRRIDAALHRTERREPEVARLSGAASRILIQNHIGERVRLAFEVKE